MPQKIISYIYHVHHKILYHWQSTILICMSLVQHMLVSCCHPCISSWFIYIIPNWHGMHGTRYNFYILIYFCSTLLMRCAWYTNWSHLLAPFLLQQSSKEQIGPISPCMPPLTLPNHLQLFICNIPFHAISSQEQPS